MPATVCASHRGRAPVTPERVHMEQYHQQQQVYQANIVSSDKLRQDKKQVGDQRGKAERNATALSREPAPALSRLYP